MAAEGAGGAGRGQGSLEVTHRQKGALGVARVQCPASRWAKCCHPLSQVRRLRASQVQATQRALTSRPFLALARV